MLSKFALRSSTCKTLSSFGKPSTFKVPFPSTRLFTPSTKVTFSRNISLIISLPYPSGSRFIFTCINLGSMCHPRFSTRIIKKHSLFHIFYELEAIRYYMSFHMTKMRSGNKHVVLTLTN
ncbi:hypothetical protein CISIN_1g033461mg [Citrus sinensis]|uniref:Uncharacterized protein n=1 Tax=Citrus sinensis TaxID=2711 RepID=A0A067E6G4_CITSI|nr:hypothetical protein CISIN_1g033461mg [Citrus sinensis]